MAAAAPPAGDAPVPLPPWDQLTLTVTDPTKRDDYTVYKISVRSADGAHEHRSSWRRYKEFEEAFKAISQRAQEHGLPALPQPPEKKMFGRFDPKFIEERRAALESFLLAVKQQPKLCETAEFSRLTGSFAGGGYLRKKGAKTIALKDPFKTRWFQIHGKTLDYHEKQGGKKLGTIPLDEARVADCQMYQHSFCIMGAALPRMYILVAETQADKKLWQDSLNEVTGAATSTGIGAREGVEGADVADQYYTNKAAKGNAHLKSFDLVCVVGVGSFGKVMKVKRRDEPGREADPVCYAMKVLNKDQIIQNKMVAHTNAEKQILETIEHPFICKLHWAFQTKKQLIFVLDFLAGGELFYHLQRQKRFSEKRAKFYTAEIALALSTLHQNGVIYRDLKPENLVLDAEGHVVLTDFGLAKTDCKDATTYTFCGTPEYMAPELVTKQGHTSAVDWWSLGIFLYEMVVGIPPFYQQNVSQMYQLILNKPLECPKFVSPALEAVLKPPQGLLERDPKQRLCDINILKKHEFFAGTDWDAMLRREITPEFVPNLSEQGDTKYFDAEFTQQGTDLPGGDDYTGKDVGAGKFGGFAQG